MSLDTRPVSDLCWCWFSPSLLTTFTWTHFCRSIPWKRAQGKDHELEYISYRHQCFLIAGRHAWCLYMKNITFQHTYLEQWHRSSVSFMEGGDFYSREKTNSLELHRSKITIQKSRFSLQSTSTTSLWQGTCQGRWYCKRGLFSSWVIDGAQALQLSDGKSCSCGDRVCRKEKCSPASWPSRLFQKLLLLFRGDVERFGSPSLDTGDGKVVPVGWCRPWVE